MGLPVIPITGRNGAREAKEFWWVERRKSNGSLMITRAMTTVRHTKRTSQRVSFLMVIGGSSLFSVGSSESRGDRE